MKTLIRSLAAAAVLFAVNAQAQDLQPLDRIAAVVDEDVILASELERAVANIRAQYATRQDQLHAVRVHHQPRAQEGQVIL